MSTILSAVCPLEAAVIVSTESLYLLARQRRKQGWTQVRGFQRFVSICNHATSTITEGYEWEQTPSNGLANRNPTPAHTKRTTLRRNDISTAFTHRITAGIFNSRRRRIGVIWGGGVKMPPPQYTFCLTNFLATELKRGKYRRGIFSKRLLSWCKDWKIIKNPCFTGYRTDDSSYYPSSVPPPPIVISKVTTMRRRVLPIQARLR
jgi:hypothetical protein